MQVCWHLFVFKINCFVICLINLITLLMRPLFDSITEYLSNKLGHYHVRLGKEFIKFCIVGTTNLLIYISIYWLTTRQLSWHYSVGSVAGFLVAVTWSFYFNLKWTFKSKIGEESQQYIKFVVANIVSLLFNLAFLALFIEFFRIYDLLAQFMSSFIVAFINFGLNRFWTFRSH